MISMDNKTFKDFINEDLDVFLNLDEFADEHELDGEIVPAIIVNSQSNDDMSGFPREQLYATQEVYKQIKTIYVKSTDYGVPKVDSSITLDGEEYFVDAASEVSGIIKIVVYVNES